MKRNFKGKCKNCPYGERSKINKDSILCEFGGIRELDSKCNILVLGESLFKFTKTEKRRKHEEGR